MEKIEVLFVLILMLLLTSCKQDAAGPSDTPASAAPSITQHPANVTLMVGQTATFSVVATGTSPLSYQWQKNGVNASGATNSSYSLVVSMSDSGSSFRCVVSNAEGSVTSNSAFLNAVSAPVAPTITGHPSSVVAFAGDTVTRSVVATGTGPLSYQWQKNGVTIAGAISASYTFVATYSDSGKSLRCVVSNTAGSAVSNPALLNVTQLIEIGRPYLGGTIFWLDGAGGGLVAALYDQSDSTNGMTHQELVDRCRAYGPGYDLPDSTELKLLKRAKDLGIVTNFVSPMFAPAGHYISSTEMEGNPGWYFSIGFNNGSYNWTYQYANGRAVRRF